MKYRQNAFTLIETLVYLALFSFLMTGIVVVTYSIFESSDRNQTKIMVQEEGNFLVAKISWALSGTKSFNVNGPEELSVEKYDVSGTGTTKIVIKLSGTDSHDIYLKYPDEPEPNEFQLNNSNVEISNLAFVRGDTNPEYVRADFKINARTLNGMIVSQDFSMVKYLRK
jgi:type II secretory pathway pseudopilin PulG